MQLGYALSTQCFDGSRRAHAALHWTFKSGRYVQSSTGPHMQQRASAAPYCRHSMASKAASLRRSQLGADTSCDSCEMTKKPMHMSMPMSAVMGH